MYKFYYGIHGADYNPVGKVAEKGRQISIK
jgi:hypothetical protein